MTVHEFLILATQQLERAGIGTARLDVLVLLEDVTGLDRAKLLAEPERVLTAVQVAKLKKLLNRRAGHEPLAYLRGFTEFYGRNFVITPAVLEPRPESETMIDLLKQLAKDSELAAPMQTSSPRPVWIGDVGAGSGALGITAQLELPEVRVELLEIDPKACKVARQNVDKHTSPTVAIEVIKSDLLLAGQHDYDVLLCNLPYVPDDYQINEAAGQEPALAIFGGPDGLDVYRRLFQQLSQRQNQPLFILTESLPPQHPALAAIAQEHGYRQSQEADFIQLFSQP